MSKSLDQLQEIGSLLPLLKKAREDAAAARKRVAALELRLHQDLAHVVINGLRLDLTYLDRDTGYMPRVVPGMAPLLAACRKAAIDARIAADSKVEGLERRLAKLATGGAA